MTARTHRRTFLFIMPGLDARLRRSVPLRALALSLAALLVPITGSFWTPEAMDEYRALLWLVALIPAFLLAYYRGWRGVATALAAGMATLSLTQAVATWVGHSIPDLLFGVVVAYVAISLGIGWLAEIFHRDVDEVEHLAFTDILTGLPNRRHARVFLDLEFAAAERGRPLSVVLFDLDDFKTYNDEHGHQAGDEALKEFAETLRVTTRKMDLSARFGGEEFLSVLAGSDSEGALIFGDRVRASMKERAIGGKRLTVSAGAAAYHPNMSSPDELLAAADHALYQAKREGRDCVRLFGRTLLDETPEPRRELPNLQNRATSNEYPRSAEELGRTQPPLTLLPHQITGFGSGYRVLVVEEDERVRELISTYLSKEGFSVSEASEVLEAIRALRTEFDVVVTDLQLPKGDGNDLVSAIKSRWSDTQVLAISEVEDARASAGTLDTGADRHLNRPFGMSELRAEIEEALSTRDRDTTVGDSEPREDGPTEGPKRDAPDVVTRSALGLAEAVEVRLPHLRGHGRRVAAYADCLVQGADPEGEQLDRSQLRLACRLHDVGLLQVPRAILEKEGRLTSDEYERVREHPRLGRQALEPMLDVETVLEVATWHHEHWDGSGYPDGLVGDSIPLSARVASVADALDAMTTSRPHREARSWEAALQEIRDSSGTQFDPGLIDVLETCRPRLRAVFDTEALSDAEA